MMSSNGVDAAGAVATAVDKAFLTYRRRLIRHSGVAITGDKTNGIV